VVKERGLGAYFVRTQLLFGGQTQSWNISPLLLWRYLATFEPVHSLTVLLSQRCVSWLWSLVVQSLAVLVLCQDQWKLHVLTTAVTAKINHH